MKKLLIITAALFFAVNAFAAVPTVLGIAPDSGPVTGGTLVTISGANFTGATEVLFNGMQAASLTVTNDTELTCISPASSAGTVDVTVTNADGQSFTSVIFTYLELTPTMTQTVIHTATQTITPTVTRTYTPVLTATSTEADTALPTSTRTGTGTPADSATFTVTQTPSPTATASYTRTVTGTYTDTPTGTVTRTNTPTSSVTATVTITRTATPTATLTLTATVVITPTVVESLYEVLKGTLYPNPVKAGEYIYMIYDFPDWNYNVKITVYTLDGRIAKETEAVYPAGKGRLALGTKDLAPGVYFYKTLLTEMNTLMVVGAQKKTEVKKKLVITK